MRQTDRQIYLERGIKKSLEFDSFDSVCNVLIQCDSGKKSQRLDEFDCIVGNAIVKLTNLPVNAQMTQSGAKLLQKCHKLWVAFI